MSVTDKILQRVGLEYSDLNTSERETLEVMADSLSKNKLTIDAVREYVASMLYSVQLELSETEHNTKQDILLKARMRNYMLLGAFLNKPLKAKEALDRALSGIVNKKK